MRSARSAIRKGATAVAAILATVLVAPVISEFFIEWAKEKGAYESPSQRVSNAMDALAALTQSWWFALVLGLFGGLAVALWFVRLFPEPTAEKGERASKNPSGQPSPGGSRWMSRQKPDHDTPDKSRNKFILTNLTRFFAAGNEIALYPVKSDNELKIWEMMRQNWHNEVNAFVFVHISAIDGNKLRYVTIKKPLRFDSRYNDSHNRSLNIMQECLDYIEVLIKKYSDAE